MRTAWWTLVTAAAVVWAVHRGEDAIDRAVRGGPR